MVELKATVYVLLSMLTLITLSIYPVMGEGEASISVVRDYIEDADNDGVVDYLSIDVTLFLPHEGNYQLLAIIKNSGGLKTMDMIHASGEYNTTLHFSARDIYESGLSGRLVIAIYLTEDSSIVARTTYTTHEYSQSDFNPAIIHGVKSEDVQLHLGESSVTIESRNMTVDVHTVEPVVIYRSTGSEQEVFVLNFTGITFYNDTNSNGQYDSGEEVLYADMSSGIWSLKLGLIEGYSRFDFSIIGAFSTPKGEFEIEFRYSRGMNTVNSFERQKFDIYIRAYGIPAQRVVLWHTLTAIGDASVGQLEETNDAFYVRHYDSDGRELGFYSFLSKATAINGFNETTVKVNGYTRNGVFAMDYPLAGEIHHDPEVALDPSLAPGIVKKVVEVIIRNNPVIFGISATVTSAVVAMSIVHYRKKRNY